MKLALQYTAAAELLLLFHLRLLFLLFRLPSMLTSSWKAPPWLSQSQRRLTLLAASLRVPPMTVHHLNAKLFLALFLLALTGLFLTLGLTLLLTRLFLARIPTMIFFRTVCISVHDCPNGLGPYPLCIFFMCTFLSGST